MPSLSPARRIAFDVLLRVESGAWASDLLRAASAGLDTRDAALAHQIVFGTLRRQRELDLRIAEATAGKRLDPEVRIALRAGLFQIHHLDRVPKHAVVSDSVQLVKRARKTSAAGFVNAILRRQDSSKIVELDTNVPDWLYQKWIASYGEQKAKIIAEAALQEPTSQVPVPPLHNEPENSPQRLQDPGSQWVVTLLELQKGLSFLDICAAPGNKTLQALAAGATATACDLHHHRLRAMLGDVPCPLVQLDATRPLPFRQLFDRVLVDAPCSGTGTLGRNPEIQWRLKPEDLADLHGRQVAILRNALAMLAPGGLLVYSTCSLEPEENEEVVREVLGSLPDETFQRLPGIDPGDGFFASVIRSK